MKKLLLSIAFIPTLLLGACNNNEPLQEKYVEIIRDKFYATDWCYTYQKVEPKSKNAYIIDFYVFEPSRSYSIWLCYKQNSEYKCDLIKINNL